MRRLLPKTLRGQLVFVILATFVVVQGISLWLFVDERQLAVRAALGLEAAGRAANVVRLLEATPEALHPDILRAANSPFVRFTLADQPSIAATGAVFAQNGLRERVRRFLADGSTREIRVTIHRAAPPRLPEGAGPEMLKTHRQMMGLGRAPVEMQLSIALQNGPWLNVSSRFLRPPIQWPWASILSFALATLIIAAAVWVALSRLTGPLRRLASAAESLGRGEEVAPLPEQGPEELRRLTDAFNEMQARLSRFVSERTRLLAALGHDLRSPLTAMRVRAEMVDDDETRERLAAIIAEMQEMVESTLSFARGMVTSEKNQTVDLLEFLRTMEEEFADTGGKVTVDGAPGVMVRVKPVAMRRALRNVIENAVRYGKQADVRVWTGDDSAHVTVIDQGPGIPEADLERVFDAFVRMEKSRNLETGGTGLGLSIARTVIHAHGGDIRLENAAGGGLSADITLPLAIEG